MKLKDAYRILRRYEDFRIGFDYRCVCDAFPSGEHREAVQRILASRGLGKPIINCAQCVHQGVGVVYHGLVPACKLHVKGECTKFEEVQP